MLWFWMIGLSLWLGSTSRTGTVEDVAKEKEESKADGKGIREARFDDDLHPPSLFASAVIQ